MSSTPKTANKLIHSTSPYLLQHAYNPVDWYPWGKEALDKAIEEDKPILVSIGYSSCHWCHVMEKESFENDSIAEIMNKHFINIKIDREERPDLDQIYMDAVQLMGQNGGWPLNVFLTPDQKPFYGGTYFPPQNWSKLLTSVSRAFNEQRKEIQSSADKLAYSLSQDELEKYGYAPSRSPFTEDVPDSLFQAFSQKFDREKGGLQKAPKFPMPSNWKFLLDHYELSKNETALNHALETLNKIANGGIYDHIGGGFARYSTDADWFAPHFEKMLYDNGQLLSVYADAYKISGDDFYKLIIDETYQWLNNEMSDPSGGFYSAIDADSEGTEGKFYVWTEEELDSLLGSRFEIFKRVYNTKMDGNWEKGQNILYMNQPITDLTKEEFKIIQECKSILSKARSTRKRPLTDTKVLSGWNAMTISGLTQSYEATGNIKYLERALKAAEFLQDEMIDSLTIYRSYKDNKTSGTGYLEDYAFVITAFLDLYQATFDEKWLHQADQLTNYAIDEFFDEEDNLFFFTSASAEQLIARKKEIFDNVISSSNSQMAINLHALGIIMDNDQYKTMSDNMLRQVVNFMQKDPVFLINWATLYQHKVKSTCEIVIMGENANAFRKELSSKFLPNAIIMGSESKSDLPLLEFKEPKEGETMVYVCYNKTCKFPVNSVSKAMEQIQ